MTLGEAADYAILEAGARVVSPHLARTSSKHLAEKAPEDPENALIEAHTVVAALGLVLDIRDHLEAEA